MTIADIYLVFGKNGWIGGKVIDLLRKQEKNVVLADSRMENRESVVKEIELYKPTHVIVASGITGRPNICALETQKPETIRANVVGVLNVADVCHTAGVHCTVFATGCIYEYDTEHTIGGKGFTEEDEPNFRKSFYSDTKATVEKLLKCYNNMCILRVRMPISDDLSHRNFITKITNYEKVVDVKNSMTILTELLPISVLMAERKLEGVYNFCNPGAISHNEILDMYKQYIDPSFTYNNFTVEEQSKILKAGRSNNTLDVTKLIESVPDVKIDDIHTAMIKVFKRMKFSLDEE